MDESRQTAKPKLNQGDKMENRPNPDPWSKVQKCHWNERGSRSRHDSSKHPPHGVETIKTSSTVEDGINEATEGEN